MSGPKNNHVGMNWRSCPPKTPRNLCTEILGEAIAKIFWALGIGRKFFGEAALVRGLWFRGQSDFEIGSYERILDLSNISCRAMAGFYCS